LRFQGGSEAEWWAEITKGDWIIGAKIPKGNDSWRSRFSVHTHSIWPLSLGVRVCAIFYVLCSIPTEYNIFFRSAYMSFNRRYSISLAMSTPTLPLIDYELYETTVVRLDSPKSLPELYFVPIDEDSWVCCRFHAFWHANKQFTHLPIVFQIHGKISAQESSLTSAEGVHGIQHDGEPPMASCWVEEVKGQAEETWCRTIQRLRHIVEQSETTLDTSLLFTEGASGESESDSKLSMLQIFWYRLKGVSVIPISQQCTSEVTTGCRDMAHLVKTILRSTPNPMSSVKA
jgi:hypothetical protein